MNKPNIEITKQKLHIEGYSFVRMGPTRTAQVAEGDKTLGGHSYKLARAVDANYQDINGKRERIISKPVRDTHPMPKEQRANASREERIDAIVRRFIAPGYEDDLAKKGQLRTRVERLQRAVTQKRRKVSQNIF